MYMEHFISGLRFLTRKNAMTFRLYLVMKIRTTILQPKAQIAHKSTKIANP